MLLATFECRSHLQGRELVDALPLVHTHSSPLEERYAFKKNAVFTLTSFGGIGTDDGKEVALCMKLASKVESVYFTIQAVKEGVIADGALFVCKVKEGSMTFRTTCDYDLSTL